MASSSSASPSAPPPKSCRGPLLHELVTYKFPPQQEKTFKFFMKRDKGKDGLIAQTLCCVTIPHELHGYPVVLQSDQRGEFQLLEESLVETEMWKAEMRVTNGPHSSWPYQNIFGRKGRPGKVASARGDQDMTYGPGDPNLVLSPAEMDQSWKDIDPDVRKKYEKNQLAAATRVHELEDQPPNNEHHMAVAPSPPPEEDLFDGDDTDPEPSPDDYPVGGAADPAPTMLSFENLAHAKGQVGGDGEDSEDDEVDTRVEAESAVRRVDKATATEVKRFLDKTQQTCEAVKDEPENVDAPRDDGEWKDLETEALVDQIDQMALEPPAEFGKECGTEPKETEVEPKGTENDMDLNPNNSEITPNATEDHEQLLDNDKLSSAVEAAKKLRKQREPKRPEALVEASTRPVREKRVPHKQKFLDQSPPPAKRGRPPRSSSAKGKGKDTEAQKELNKPLDKPVETEQVTGGQDMDMDVAKEFEDHGDVRPIVIYEAVEDGHTQEYSMEEAHPEQAAAEADREPPILEQERKLSEAVGDGRTPSGARVKKPRQTKPRPAPTTKISTRGRAVAPLAEPLPPHTRRRRSKKPLGNEENAEENSSM